ncbi:MAG: hypothetical protein Q4C78_05400 [Synergistaceae bacterium]|nr:hypothetical protein [Synergistaceae bacterium]
MKNSFLLKESYISYVFWSLFVIALIFYFALHIINTRLSDINYLLSQKSQLESRISKNAVEIITLQNSVKRHSASFDNILTPEAFTRKLEKLLQQYAFANDCLTIKQNDGVTTYSIEDTTDYFLLQSFLLEICRLRTNVTDLSMKAEGKYVHFVITILK